MRIITAALVVMTAIACRAPQKKQASEQRLPFYATADFTPVFAADVPDSFHHIPPFHLVAHTGKAVSEKDMDGKITIVDFFFTSCPGICPRMAVNMKMLQDSFLTEDRIQLFSHSVTPDRDSIPVLQSYAKSKGVDARRWLLLTGPKKTIYDLGRKSYFVEEDMGLAKDTSQFLHTENFILVDAKRRIRGIYNGLSTTSVRRLVEDARELLAINN